MKLSDYCPSYFLNGEGGAKLPGWSLFSINQPSWAFFLDFAVYPALILLCAYEALAGAGGERLTVFLATAVAGYGLWTFAEYVLHRAVFHHVPGFRSVHLAHHDAPRELIGTPTLVSAAVFLVLVYAPLIEILGRQPGSALSAGLLAGYLAYVSVHYLVHHSGSGGFAFLRRLKRHHALHHHLEDRCNYGVTTRLWDRLFGTLQ